VKRTRPQPPVDAPAGTMWFGGPIGWFSVSLSVSADALIPAAVTKLLGVSPQHEQTRGVALLRADGTTKRVPKFGSWVIEVTPKETDEWDVEEAAKELLKRLPDDPEVWRSLSLLGSVRLSIALQLQSANQGFALEAEFCRSLAERNIGLDVHVYAGEGNDS